MYTYINLLHYKITIAKMQELMISHRLMPLILKSYLTLVESIYITKEGYVKQHNDNGNFDNLYVYHENENDTTLLNMVKKTNNQYYT